MSAPPVDLVLLRLKGVKKNGKGWLALCPAHDDHQASLSITEGEDGRVLIKDFGGCATADVCAAMGLTLVDLAPRSTASRASLPTVRPFTGLPSTTLQELAAWKKLPEEFLKQLGCKEVVRGSHTYVSIPYRGEQGETLSTRFRHSRDGEKRFSWKKGSKTHLYGLDRLGDVREAGWVLLVEGESDSWTCWHAGVPALGVPGKSTWHSDWARFFLGLDVFVWQEPQAEDFTRRIGRDLPNARVIVAPDDAKDISEAHCRGVDVLSLMDELKATSMPVSVVLQAGKVRRIEVAREAARTTLEAPDPLALVTRAVGEMGYGGDPTPVLITYLALTSRLLAMREGSMPVHVLLLGVPSAGKSYALKVALRLMPDDAYRTYEASSPRVLIYDTGDLRHRAVIFGEADSLPAGEDNPAASAVRNLLQDHRLRYDVTVKSAETRDFVVKHIDKPGPTVLITTATRSLGAQLMSRLFTVEIADTQAQTSLALKAQAAMEVRGAPPGPPSSLVAYQSYLGELAPWEVVVPFAEELAERIAGQPNETRVLRDFARLMSLIKAVAVLRHASRRIDEDGTLHATIDDYRMIFDLVGDVYEVSSSGAGRTIRETVAAVAALLSEDRKEVDKKAIAEWLGISQQATGQRVKKAQKGGWLVNAEDRGGRPARITLGEPLPARSGLPHPDSLGGKPVNPVTDGYAQAAPPKASADSSALRSDPSREHDDMQVVEI